MTTSEGYVTTADGVRLYYQSAGEDPKLVLIPNGVHLFDDFKHLAAGRSLIFYDVRNRGRSDAVADSARLARGIHHDVDDFDAVRRHFGGDAVGLVGHSYVGLTVVLCAMQYPSHVDCVVQIGPMGPSQSKQYPPHLTNADDTLREVLGRLAELEKERSTLDPVQFCEKFWSVLGPLYVADPADAGKIRWSRCELANERNFMESWLQYLLPSIQALTLTADDFARVQARVLTIHGRKDRSAPYGAGREWALLLPNARLLTVERAAHAPWIEAPRLFFDALQTFLDGAWPRAAEKVTALDPGGSS
jgi:pimeloyl-ACP methyl ester carboxylesterase